MFQQVIGTLMESDPAPFMANLFLFYYEGQMDVKDKTEKLDST